jgi:hypothetical protein
LIFLVLHRETMALRNKEHHHRQRRRICDGRCWLPFVLLLSVCCYTAKHGSAIAFTHAAISSTFVRRGGAITNTNTVTATSSTSCMQDGSLRYSSTKSVTGTSPLPSNAAAVSTTSLSAVTTATAITTAQDDDATSDPTILLHDDPSKVRTFHKIYIPIYLWRMSMRCHTQS